MSSTSPTPRSFVVTTSVGDHVRSQIWHPSEPLSIGFPFRWVVEQAEGGVRVRNVATAPGEIQKDAVKTVTQEMIEKGTVIDLPQSEGKGKMTFQIRPMKGVRPAFERPSTQRSGELQAYACIGNWMTNAQPLGHKYTGYLHAKPAFIIERPSGDYRVKFLIEGTRVGTSEEETSPGTQKPVTPGQTITLSSDKLAQSTISIGSMTWRFGAVEMPALPPVVSAREIDPETVWFKKAAIGTLAGLAAFILLTVLWPKPQEKPEVLVPPQFTRLVMHAQSSEASTPSKSAKTAQEIASPKKASQTAVVQAFRAKALENAVSGLLRGGMTTLLAQSDFVTGLNASADAKRIFNSKNDSLRAMAPETGLMNSPHVKVAALGGEAGGKGGVGYGKGEHAGVTGQGRSWVAMDTSSSTVEDGLTKDEVGAVIHSHLSEVRYCYESAMLRSPDIEGKLVVDFVIGAPGTVKSAGVKESTLPDPRLDDCVIRRLMSWKFPQTKGGVDVSVSYPFIFKTLGR